MRLFGLIGFPLEHSFSAKYFAQKFENEGIKDCRYELFPLENIETLRTFIGNKPGLVGLNVTIPYKRQVIKYMDEVDPVAKQCGSVNTIKIQRTAQNIYLKAYNTDVVGFKQSLLDLIGASRPNALILGNGGSSKSVSYVLNQLNIKHHIISRKRTQCTLSYEDLHNKNLIGTHKLIINTTPLGMFPNTEGAPDIPYHDITDKHFLFDLIYNPAKTKFLQLGEEKNALNKNGFQMLHIQAEEAWKIWI